MSCQNCKGVKGIVNKVSNIAEGYTHLILKDAVIEKAAEERLSICNQCELRVTIPVAKVDICKVCKCVLIAKARATDEHCPKSKW